MKTSLIFLFFSFAGFLSAQDYNLVFEQYMTNGSSWSGDYTEGDVANTSATLNNITISVQNDPDPEFTAVGSGSMSECFQMPDAMDGSNNNGDGLAYLANDRTLRITNNHPLFDVHIQYFDPTGGGFVCAEIGAADCVLGPGESTTLLREGNNIVAIEGACADAVPTLSQWGLIILALLLGCIGFVAIRKEKPWKLAVK